MPTSSQKDADKNQGERATKRRRLSPLWAAIILLVLALIPLNIALSLALEPYGTQSELAWTDYRQAEDVDTLFIGTSASANALDPQAFDTVLGSHSYNLATPSQSLHESLTAIKAVSKDHNLKRVVMLLGYETMVIEPRFAYAVPFVQAKGLGERPLQAAVSMAELYTYDYYFTHACSLLGIFPWAYVHVDLTPSRITENVKNRLRYDVREASLAYARKYDPTWEYRGRGFGSYTDTLKASDMSEGITSASTEAPFSSENLKSLEQLCSWCHEQGIELYVFGAPYRPASVLVYGDQYPTRMEGLKEIIARHGAHFFDLNMLRPDILSLSLSDFRDTRHLSSNGAPKATELVAQYIGQLERGESIDSCFFGYDGASWQQWCNTIDFVDAVSYSSELVAGGGMEIVAKAYTGPNTPVEYRLDMHDPATGKWVTVQDWNDSPRFVLNDGSGHAHIRVYARAAGGQEDGDRYMEGTIVW